jgi:hypothetical protein
MKAASRAVTYFFLAKFSQLAKNVLIPVNIFLIKNSVGSKISKKTFFEEKSSYFSIG